MDLIGVRYHGLSVAVRREIDRATWASGWLSLFLFPSENRFLLFSSDPHCTYYESRKELP